MKRLPGKSIEKMTKRKLAEVGEDGLKVV